MNVLEYISSGSNILNVTARFSAVKLLAYAYLYLYNNSMSICTFTLGTNNLLELFSFMSPLGVGVFE